MVSIGLDILRWMAYNATRTSPIMQLICSPKFCITVVFDFSWVLQLSQEKLKTMLLPIFFCGGRGGGGAGAGK